MPQACWAPCGQSSREQQSATTVRHVPTIGRGLHGGAGLIGLVAAGTHAPYLLLVLPMIAAGAGMALTMPAATPSVMESAPAGRGGIASGVINAARQAGGVLGVAVLGSLCRYRPGSSAGCGPA